MPPLEPPFDGATATILIEGLAICSFSPNPNNQRGDVGFLRPADPEHSLKLIFETNDPNNPRLVFPISPSDKIVIGAKNQNVAAEPLCTFSELEFKQGTFDRKTPLNNHPKDFRWTLDVGTVADEVKQPQPKSTGESGKIPVTFAYIYDAVFYTNDITNQEVALLPNNMTDANHLDANGELTPFVLGKGNVEVAADIVCNADGEVTVMVIGSDGTVKLDESLKDSEKQGKPHRVRLQNIEAPKHIWVKDDFHFYYEALGFSPDFEVWSQCQSSSSERGAGCCCQCSRFVNLTGFTGYDSTNLRP